MPRRAPTRETAVRFQEWPLISEGPREAWGDLNLIVHVEHEGDPAFFTIVEIEVEGSWAGQKPTNLPDVIDKYVREQIDMRAADREAISEAIRLEAEDDEPVVVKGYFSERVVPFLEAAE